jgi:hypothetical protein
MPWGGDAANARERFDLPVHELERHGLEVVGEIARRGPLVRVEGEVELPFLHDVPRTGKGQGELPRLVPVGVPARVIEVEVGIDHAAHVLRPMAQLGERVLELRAAVGPFVLETVDVPELRVLLAADPGVDQHEAVVVLDQQAAKGERDPIAVVRRDPALPQGLGHDPEHGAAIQALHAALEGVTGEAADAEGGVRHVNAERGSGNAEL